MCTFFFSHKAIVLVHENLILIAYAIIHEVISIILLLISMPIHVLQYVIHAQKRSCTHLSFGTYVQKRRVIFVHA